MELIQIFALVFAIFAMFKIIMQLKNNEINLESAIFWIFIWVLVILIVVFPQTMSHLATLTGVGRGVDVVIYVAIIILFYLLYRLYIKIENIEREITLIVREIAILEKEKKEKEKQ
ncbi:hypothetical protein CFE53_05355 [Methanofervidicoccus sp. A16]|uniref:DUF2304 domain-containing protein n=1 Tax=Methanofervidicoccus sp. A16 TaxID=2607662 RepID=UPI00118C54BB|nr:DUF2304 family protein [Methanofervidicoccus sp. A16]AXI25580.1 hypothetical protein CFE53_05355 [Methanofervidicoccus sp. A16]